MWRQWQTWQVGDILCKIRRWVVQVLENPTEPSKSRSGGQFCCSWTEIDIISNVGSTSPLPSPSVWHQSPFPRQTWLLCSPLCGYAPSPPTNAPPLMSTCHHCCHCCIRSTMTPISPSTNTKSLPPWPLMACLTWASGVCQIQHWMDFMEKQWTLFSCWGWWGLNGQSCWGAAQWQNVGGREEEKNWSGSINNDDNWASVRLYHLQIAVDTYTVANWILTQDVGWSNTLPKLDLFGLFELRNLGALDPSFDGHCGSWTVDFVVLLRLTGVERMIVLVVWLDGGSFGGIGSREDEWDWRGSDDNDRTQASTRLYLLQISLDTYIVVDST